MALTGIVATTTLAELLGMEVGDIIESGGGGGGIEIEKGYYTVAQTASSISVVYENEHDRPADITFCSIINEEGVSVTANGVVSAFYVNWSRFLTKPSYLGQIELNGCAGGTASGGATLSGGTVSNIRYNHDDTAHNTSMISANYYSTNTGATWKVASTNRSFLKDSEFQWVAIWLPND